MFKPLLPGLLVAAVLSTGAVASAQDAPAPLANEDQRAVYALGQNLWKSLQTYDLTAEEIEILERALEDAAAGRESAVKAEEAGPLLETFRKARVERRAAREKELGKAALEKAAAEPGAVKTSSGMVYQELVAGTGATPTAADTVSVHYKGTLVDGTEFDSSYKRKEPAKFPLGRVIPCWTEGVQKMKVGGKSKLVCPSDLAYGDRGRPSIPPGATLVFEVELVDVIKLEPKPAPAPKPEGESKPESKPNQG
ncbi:MAG: FKBP-type peptidyl-prolyl cis-trans isomerase [Thermoanaerobaculia bacterium]|nr:MAG: FKBP-type peptidyl-prolyl cis-trans isomerase [Thermoanaerobaculia bacterium]